MLIGGSEDVATKFFNTGKNKSSEDQQKRKSRRATSCSTQAVKNPPVKEQCTECYIYPGTWDPLSVWYGAALK
jgi:hypothetical protein